MPLQTIMLIPLVLLAAPVMFAEPASAGFGQATVTQEVELVSDIGHATFHAGAVVLAVGAAETTSPNATGVYFLISRVVEGAGSVFVRDGERDIGPPQGPTARRPISLLAEWRAGIDNDRGPFTDSRGVYGPKPSNPGHDLLGEQTYHVAFGLLYAGSDGPIRATPFVNESRIIHIVPVSAAGAAESGSGLPLVALLLGLAVAISRRRP